LEQRTISRRQDIRRFFNFFENKPAMKSTVQKPSKPEGIKSPKRYSSLENALLEKHQKANEFIKKVKLSF
jgi:hypothetical protein